MTSRCGTGCGLGCSILTAPTRNLSKHFAQVSHHGCNGVRKMASGSCCMGSFRISMGRPVDVMRGVGHRTPFRTVAHKKRVACMRLSNRTRGGVHTVTGVMGIVCSRNVNCNSVGRPMSAYRGYKCGKIVCSGYPMYRDRGVLHVHHVANCLANSLDS